MQTESTEPSLNITISEIASLLIRSPLYAFHPTINEVLRLIGIRLGADRVCLLKPDEKHSSLELTNEWVIHPDLRSNMLIYEYKIELEQFPFWQELLSIGKPLTINSVNDLGDEAKHERAELQRDNIKSLAVIPVIEQKEQISLISIDFVTQEHHWDKAEITWLEQLVSILAPYIAKSREAENQLIEEDLSRKINFQAVISDTYSDDKSVKELELLWEASVQLLKLHTKEQVFAYASSILYRLLGKSIVVVTEHLEYEGLLITRNITGINKTVEKVVEMTRYKTIGHKQKINPDYLNLLFKEKAMLHKIEGGVFEASMGLLSKEMSLVVEKTLGIKALYGLGFYANNILFGTALLILRERQQVNKEVLESFSHMISMSLERIFSQQALLKSKRDQHDILEYMSKAVIRADSHGKIVYANKAATKISGYSLDELKEKTLVEFAYSASDAETIKSIALDNYTNADNSFVTEIKSKTGEKRIIEVKGSKIMGQRGSIKGYLGVVSDITDFRQKEAALIDMETNRKAREFKDLFLSNMSHEMLTPINGIAGIADILLQKNTNKETAELLKIIEESTQQLLKTIESIWETMKLREGSSGVNFRNFNLCDILHHNHKLFRAAAFEKNIDFNVRCNQMGDFIIQSDEFKINQILSNLIGNAVKFTERKGKIEVIVTITMQEEDHALLRFDIKDNGIGVPEDKKQFLFDIFEQADNSHSRVHQGLGLGLYISKQLTHRLSGEIGFSSKDKGGSHFWVEIPVSIISEPKEFKDCLCHLSERYEPRVVVLLNKVTIKKVMEIVFRQLNVSADFVFSINALNEILKSEQYKVLFVSPEVPELNSSQETLLQIINKHKLPILALADKETCGYMLDKSLDIFSDYIDNPFIASNLADHLYRWAGINTVSKK